jgi:GNAT superfamily N-acetyltransferase
MAEITLRPIEPDQDFGKLAEWFSILDESATTPASLADYYERNKDRALIQVAVDHRDQPVGFYWAVLSPSGAQPAFIYLYVDPEQRKQGLGSRLYDAMLPEIRAAGAKKIKTFVKEIWPEAKAFADKHGLYVERQQFAMELDLDGFDDRLYENLIEKLKGEGFQFTSAAELGNTEEVHRQLFKLNDDCVVTTMGSDGAHAWGSFEEFQRGVVQASWYNPAGQIVVIDTNNGSWAAMSAITKFDGNEFAYNLFTGVDSPYRGRKLGQAVKVTALRFARSVLGVHKVRTHHNTKNEPMIAIDRKFGYVQLPGDYVMERLVTGDK